MSRTDPPPVKDLSRIAAENNPDAVAFADGADGETVTWSAFDERSSRAANALRQYVGQGDRVAFLCESSVDFVTLWNGALKAGCIVSNLHAGASPETLRYDIDELRPRVLVVDAEHAELVENHLDDEVSTALDAVVTVGPTRAEDERSMDGFLDGHAADEPDVRVDADDVMAVLWTSGTTGRPKGWCLTNRGFYERGMKLATAKGYTRHSGRIQGLTPAFAAWYSGTAPAMVTNASTYFLRTWDPAAFLRVIDERAPTHATLVPTMWRELVNLEGFRDYDLSSLERVTAAGEPLDASILELLREHVCERVTNAYAATEVLGTTITNEELEGDHVESVGKPLPGTELRVVEEGGPPDAEKPPGAVGEIIVKGSDAVVWAWGDTAQTDAVFEDGWWYSDDLGYKDEEGFLFLSGRKDFMILSKGIKVYPPPIEERLNAHPGVAESAVIGVEDEEYGEKVTAIVNRADPDLTADDLEQWCLESEALARYERPRAYHFVDEPLPRTVTGKTDREAALRELIDEAGEP
ncbi:MAG: class I adenylate-forming enzyme family protein [Halobacteriales archaeon]